MPAARTKSISPVEFKPSQGGRLMIGPSAESVGIANWTVKRDWRRDLEKEARAEGWDGFEPNPLVRLGALPTPDPVTLIAEVVRPNGAVAVIVGTQTTLWRYFGVSDGGTFSDNPNYVSLTGTTDSAGPYVVDGYVAGPEVGWLMIGGNFSASGRRWEQEVINGYLVLNNGVDLPMTYRLEELAVKPIYELREQGVASVGTIAQHDTLLVCGDIRQIVAADFLTIMKGSSAYGPVTDESVIDRLPWRVIQSMPDEPRRWGAIVDCGGFFGLDSANTVLMGYTPLSVEAGQEILILGIGANGANVLATIVTIGVTGVSAAAVNHPGSGYTANDVLTLVTGTGTKAKVKVLTVDGSGAVLTAEAVASGTYTVNPTVVSEGSNGGSGMFATFDLTMAPGFVVGGNAISSLGGSGGWVSQFEASDALGSVAQSFTDLQGDGSAILRALTLRSTLVIYKEGPELYLLTYTGDATSPWDVVPVKLPEGAALAYRETLISLISQARYDNGYSFGSAAHIYAGRNCFYRFDLTNSVPVEIVTFQQCQELFFREAAPGEAFAVENPITQELWFCFPGASGEDKALRYDYRFGTFSTTSGAFTAAGAVLRPYRVTPGKTEQWFLMGADGGKVLRYGLVAGKEIASGRITGSQSGDVITASADFFTPGMVGRSVKFPKSRKLFAIIEYLSDRQVRVLSEEVEPGGLLGVGGEAMQGAAGETLFST